MSTPMFDVPEHFPMPVTEDGRGPAEEHETDRIVCWCGDSDCAWNKALSAQRLLHKHVWDKWYPYSRTQKWRQCVYPDCDAKEIVEAKG